MANEQCVEPFNRCIGGECSCEPGTISSGTYPNVFCARYCNKDEVLSPDNQCNKRLKLGDPCTNETDYMCPDTAYCNRQNVCACRCGAFTLAENTCAPLPVCTGPMPPLTYRSALGQREPKCTPADMGYSKTTVDGPPCSLHFVPARFIQKSTKNINVWQNRRQHTTTRGPGTEHRYEKHE
uniref:EB domain-containing protein n=1 Tax=Romanomermis culicivorax TaxID=13658 RepID=A0A915IMM3_ROMCU